jgi:signal transduction histidine kinase
MNKTISKDSGTSPEGEIAGQAGLPPDIARALSHDLRTPLSAMAGWLHLMETGALDEAGMKRAIAKLQSSLEQQVRTIDKYLGGNLEEHR